MKGVMRKERITRQLQLQQLLKDSYLTFTFTLKVNIDSLVCGFKDKSLRTDTVNQTTESTGKSSNFHVFGHNVPIYCSKLVSVRKRNEGLDEASIEALHSILCEEMTHLQAKT